MHARTKVNLAVLVALSAVSSVQAQETQRVEITGSAIRRVDAEGALPVTVITRDEIARTGATNTEELINSIAAVSTIGGITNATGAGSSTNGRSEISMRGLSGRRTLVLVNGRRLAAGVGSGTSDGAAINVNNIPLAAIERVEVLKDGASSIYGSDALAGVINFILTKDFRGFDIGVGASKPTRSGGGDSYKGSLVAGFGDLNSDRFNLTASLSFEKERQLFAKDRDFAKTGNVGEILVAGATGQGNIEGAFNPGSRSANGTWTQGTRVSGFGNSPATGYGNPLAAQDRCGEINMFLNPTKTSKNTPYCTFDSPTQVGLIPERETVALTLNGAFRINNQLELFGDGLYSRNTQIQRFQPSPVRRSFLVTDGEFNKQGVDPALLIYPTNPNYKLAADYLNANGFGSLVGQPLAITARVFDFGPRTSRDVTEQTRLVFGPRGELGEHNYEVAYSLNKYELSGSVPDGYFSQVAYAKAVQGSNEWNPWSLNQTDGFKAAIAPAKYTGSTLDGTSESKVFDAKLAGDLMKLPAGSLSYAVGYQNRDESYQSRPSAALFSGDIAGLGGAQEAVDRSRRINSLFAELVAPIVKGLEGNVSARGDHYSDVGSSTTYKASMRWQPIRQVLLRGGVGTGFRAPTLVELWLPQRVGTSAQFTDPAFPNNPNLQVNEVSGGNPNLKSEKSKQASIGIVLNPIDSVTVGLDYWRIRLDGMITAPSTQEIVSRFRAGDPAYQNLVTLNAQGEVDQTVAVNQNSGAAKVEGIDVDITSRFPLAGGRLDVGLNGTYMIRFDQTSPSGVVSRKVGTLVETDADGNTIPVLEADGGGVVLRWKHRLAATYTYGPWAFTLAQNFYTGYRTGDAQISGEPHFVKAQALYDMHVGFTGIKNLKLGLGVKNLFDKNPPLYVPVGNQFQAGYDISLYDPRGRTVFVTANYRF